MEQPPPPPRPPSPPATWVILATTNKVQGGNFTGAEYRLCRPPSVSVPVLAQEPGAKEPGYPDATVEAVAPTMWLLRYPPYKRTIPPLKTDCRYVVYNFGPFDDVEIKHFPDGFFENLNKAGIVTHPTESGHFIVADLRAMEYPDGRVVREIVYLYHDSSYDAVMCASSNDWNSREYSGLPSDKAWKWDDVVSYDGKLCWIDHAQGIFCWDAFGAGMELSHIRLPDAAAAGVVLVVRHRYVQLSRGRFRCIDICHGDGGETVLTVRTLQDPRTGVWTNADYQFTFRELFQSKGYHENMLPIKIPRFALMSPENPDVLYFFVNLTLAPGLGEAIYLYGVDGRAKILLHYCTDHGLPIDASSSSVRGWMVPNFYRS